MKIKIKDSNNVALNSIKEISKLKKENDMLKENKVYILNSEGKTIEHL